MDIREMLQFKDQFKGKKAALILGGPSIVQQKLDLSRLKELGYTVLLESKALTPYFLSFGIQPDFYLVPFPTTIKGNALHFFIYRAFLAGFNLRPLLKERWKKEYDEMKTNFDQYFEDWSPHRGLHKRYKWLDGAHVPGSAYSLIGKIPEATIVTNQVLLEEAFPSFEYRDQLCFFESARAAVGSFDYARYIEPSVKDGKVVIESNSFINSAAISLYPLLHFMGFSEVYFLGMDFTQLGSMEYAANFTFKSIAHYYWFMLRCYKTFWHGAEFRFALHRREKAFIDESRFLLTQNCSTRFVRVYSPCRYVRSVPDIEEISVAEFFQSPRRSVDIKASEFRVME